MPFTRPRAAQIDFDVTNISDPLIRLNSGQSGSGDKDVGIVVERGTDTNAAILWDESADEFVLVNTTEDGTTSGDVTISSYANLQAGTINASEYQIGSTGLVFEGATADAFETTLTVTDPTADRTITLPDLTGTVSLVTATETLENKTLRAPTFESGSNSPQFIETRYVNANQVEFVQVYGGAANGSYFTQGEYQKIATIVPDGDSQNYTCKVTMTATSASNFHIVTFYAALRSNTLPDLTWTITYEELYNGVKFIEPMLWTKETSTAGFILAFEYIRDANLYGNVNVDVEIIPRSSAQRSNITINTTANSETTSIESGYTERNPTLIRSINSGTPIFSQLRIGAQNELRFYDSDDSNFSGFRAPSSLTGDVTFTLPDGDGSANQFLKTDGSGTLTWGDAGTTAFSTISVSGESDVVADSAADTLTFVAGDGVTITTNAGTDTITFTTSSSDSVFSADNDLGNVADSHTASEDLGNVADSADSTTYDLGGIAVEGVITSAQISAGSIDTAQLATDAVTGVKISGLTDSSSGFVQADGDGTFSIGTPSTGLSDIVDDTTPQLGGDLDTNSNNINFGDNDKAQFGAGNDLQIYHDGSNSYVADAGTGTLNIQSNGTQINLQKADGTKMIEAINNGNVVLYSNGVEKIRTNGTGVEVTGDILPEANGTRDLGSASLRWQNIYTSDLNLSNGIGDYTVVEGEEDLFLYNNKSGKVFKFALIEVDPSEATPKIENLNGSTGE